MFLSLGRTWVSSVLLLGATWVARLGRCRNVFLVISVFVLTCLVSYVVKLLWGSCGAMVRCSCLWFTFRTLGPVVRNLVSAALIVVVSFVVAVRDSVSWAVFALTIATLRVSVVVRLGDSVWLWVNLARLMISGGIVSTVVSVRVGLVSVVFVSSVSWLGACCCCVGVCRLRYILFLTACCVDMLCRTKWLFIVVVMGVLSISRIGLVLFGVSGVISGMICVFILVVLTRSWVGN